MRPPKILKSPIILVFLAFVPLVRCQYYALPPLPPLCLQQITLANHACSKLPYRPVPDHHPPPRPHPPPGPHPPPELPPPIPRPPVIPPCGPPGTICPPESPESRPPSPESRPPFARPPVIPPCLTPGSCPPPIPAPSQVPGIPLLPSPYTGPPIIPPSTPFPEPLPAPPPPSPPFPLPPDASWEVESSQGHHRYHETPDEHDCCRWLKVMDVECICQIVVRLPPFLSKPLHDYTVYVDETCEVIFECPGRLA